MTNRILWAKYNEEGSGTETLKSHTKKVLNETKKLMEIESDKIKSLSKRLEIKEQKIKDWIFFSCLFHDIGKGTEEFKPGSSSNHPLYALYFLNQDYFKMNLGEGLIKSEINLVVLSVLSHHTVLHRHIYEGENFNKKPHFYEEILDFLKDYKKYYRTFFGFDFNGSFNFNVESEEPSRMVNKLLNEIEVLPKLRHESKETIKLLYCLIKGTLNKADWIASGNETSIFLSKDITERSLIKEIESCGNDFKGWYKFQEKSKNTDGNIIIKASTGEGKTEASILWALNNIKNENTKIVYTLPTRTTSNKLYERLKGIFGKYTAIVHGASSLIWKEEYEDFDVRMSQKAFQKTFTKPVTICTLDSFLYSFFNMGRWELSQNNFLNSLIIIDEIHSYDHKMLGVLVRILEYLSKNFDINFCIMSASLPTIIKRRLTKNLDFQIIESNTLYDKVPGKLEKVNSNMFDNIDRILNYLKKGKVLVVCNTVDKSKSIYEKIRDKTDKVILYNSRFTKKDREKKENEIYKKLKDKPDNFILVATQVVEISLDIDFDFLFTDIAPIDALIQRIGRMNRKKKRTNCEIKVFTDIEDDALTKRGVWAYPYPKQFIDGTNDCISEGKINVGKYLEWLDKIIDKIDKEKFGCGFKKYNNHLKENSLLFRSDINKTDLRLRDINESLETVDIIPKIFVEKFPKCWERYENTVGIPIWLYKKLSPPIKEGKIWSSVEGKYNYEEGFSPEIDNIW